MEKIIITDSSSLFTQEEALDMGIIVNPLTVSIDDISYKDFSEITSEELIEKINEGKIPRTSQPNIADLIEIYEKYSNYEILHISIADGLSGAYNSAMACRESVDNKEHIHIFNCQTLGAPQRHLVLYAKELIDKGYDIDTIISKLEDKVKTSKSFLIPLDFDFLQRGGRLSTTASLVAKTIKLVPVLTLGEEGKNLEKAFLGRTINKSFDLVIGDLKRIINDNYKIYLSHAFANGKNLDLILQKLKNEFPNNVIETFILSPTFICQSGPGSIAIQVIED